MARKIQYKAVEIAPDVHEQIKNFVAGTDLSLTKMVDIMLRTISQHISQNGLKIQMEKDPETGETRFLIV